MISKKILNLELAREKVNEMPQEALAKYKAKVAEINISDLHPIEVEIILRISLYLRISYPLLYHFFLTSFEKGRNQSNFVPLVEK